MILAITHTTTSRHTTSTGTATATGTSIALIVALDVMVTFVVIDGCDVMITVVKVAIVKISVCGSVREGIFYDSIVDVTGIYCTGI